MDKLNCEVVRDLMPLVADDVASDESKKLVSEHMETCENCRAYYDGMTAQIGKMTASPEAETSFIKFCRKMERQLSVKKVLKTMLILMVVIVLAVGGNLFYMEMTSVRSQNMPAENMDVAICRDANDCITVMVTPKDGNRWFGQYESKFVNDIFYITPTMPEWPLWYLGTSEADARLKIDDLVWENGTVNYVLRSYDVDYDKMVAAYVDAISAFKSPIKAIRWGSEDDYITLYTSGDIIPTHDELKN